MGVSFTITSVLSGLVVGRLGMGWALVIAVSLTAVSVIHLLTIRFPEPDPEPLADGEKEPVFDFRGAIDAISGVAGLYGLIFFAAFNNLLGGVFMSLMDAYGLSLDVGRGVGDPVRHRQLCVHRWRPLRGQEGSRLPTDARDPRRATSSTGRCAPCSPCSPRFRCC